MDKLPVAAISIVCLETFGYIHQAQSSLTDCFVICSNDVLHGPSWDDVMLFSESCTSPYIFSARLSAATTTL